MAGHRIASLTAVLCIALAGAFTSNRAARAQAPASSASAPEVVDLDARFPKHVTPPSPARPNTLSPEERAAGWRLLFDGQRGTAWRAAKGDAFPDDGWSTDGDLALRAAGPFELRAGGDLFSIDRYRDFVLDFEFALTPGANSGIKYRARAASTFFVDAIGCEYQILDDARHPDADKGRNGNRRLAGLYDLVAAESPWPRGMGRWNHGRIHVEGGAVAHYLNGDRVVAIDFGSAAWAEALAASKFADAPDFCAGVPGHLVLQDHGDAVRFRNLRIRPLDPLGDGP